MINWGKYLLFLKRFIWEGESGGWGGAEGQGENLRQIAWQVQSPKPGSILQGSIPGPVTQLAEPLCAPIFAI